VSIGNDAMNRFGISHRNLAGREECRRHVHVAKQIEETRQTLLDSAKPA
jgi:hypothetical protein